MFPCNVVSNLYLSLRDAMPKKINKSVVTALKPMETVWDTEIKGFGVRRQKSEVRTFVLKKQLNRKTKVFTLGRFGEQYTVEEARKIAVEYSAKIGRGTNPEEEDPTKSDQLTVKELSEIYIARHAMAYKKIRSIRSDKSNLKNHVLPLLGGKLVNNVERGDVIDFMQRVKNGETAHDKRTGNNGGGAVVRGGPGAANRCHSLLSKMFNVALTEGILISGINPAYHVPKFNERVIERYFVGDELRYVSKAISEEKNQEPYAAAAIGLLLVTGARTNEILTLKWSQVDFDRKIASLPDSKTGQKKLHLNDAAIELLHSLEKVANNPYIIAGKIEGKHLSTLTKPWNRIKSRAVTSYWRDKFRQKFNSIDWQLSEEDLSSRLAGCDLEGKEPHFLKDFRIHDLRHNFASHFASTGGDLFMLQKLLGHKSITMTQRYAHHYEGPLQQANDQVGKQLGKDL